MTSHLPCSHWRSASLHTGWLFTRLHNTKTCTWNWNWHWQQLTSLQATCTVYTVYGQVTFEWKMYVIYPFTKISRLRRYEKFTLKRLMMKCWTQLLTKTERDKWSTFIKTQEYTTKMWWDSKLNLWSGAVSTCWASSFLISSSTTWNPQPGSQTKQGKAPTGTFRLYWKWEWQTCRHHGIDLEKIKRTFWVIVEWPNYWPLRMFQWDCSPFRWSEPLSLITDDKSCQVQISLIDSDQFKVKLNSIN